MEKLLVANYKMNGNQNFYKKVNKVVNKLKMKDTIVLCPPFVYMPFFKIKNKNVFLGAQDVCSQINKKSTGQISHRPGSGADDHRRQGCDLRLRGFHSADSGVCQRRPRCDLYYQLRSHHVHSAGQVLVRGNHRTGHHDRRGD